MVFLKKMFLFFHTHTRQIYYAKYDNFLIFFVLFSTYGIFWSFLRFLYTTWKNSYCIWSFLIIFTPWQKYKHGGGSRKSILRRILSPSCMKLLPAPPCSRGCHRCMIVPHRSPHPPCVFDFPFLLTFFLLNVLISCPGMRMVVSMANFIIKMANSTHYLSYVCMFTKIVAEICVFVLSSIPYWY